MNLIKKLNGELQETLTNLEQDNIELHADNIKLSHQIEDLLNRRKKSERICNESTRPPTIFIFSFTEGSDAVKNAVLLCEVNGTLYDVKKNGSA